MRITGQPELICCARSELRRLRTEEQRASPEVRCPVPSNHTGVLRPVVLREVDLHLIPVKERRLDQRPQDRRNSPATLARIALRPPRTTSEGLIAEYSVTQLLQEEGHAERCAGIVAGGLRVGTLAERRHQSVLPSVVDPVTRGRTEVTLRVRDEGDARTGVEGEVLVHLAVESEVERLAILKEKKVGQFRTTPLASELIGLQMRQ